MGVTSPASEPKRPAGLLGSEAGNRQYRQSEGPYFEIFDWHFVGSYIKNIYLIDDENIHAGYDFKCQIQNKGHRKYRIFSGNPDLRILQLVSLTSNHFRINVGHHKISLLSSS